MLGLSVPCGLAAEGLGLALRPVMLLLSSAVVLLWHGCGCGAGQQAAQSTPVGCMRALSLLLHCEVCLMIEQHRPRRHGRVYATHLMDSSCCLYGSNDGVSPRL